jgi:hypothetical protein
MKKITRMRGADHEYWIVPDVDLELYDALDEASETLRELAWQITTTEVLNQIWARSEAEKRKNRKASAARAAKTRAENKERAGRLGYKLTWRGVRRIRAKRAEGEAKGAAT